AERALARAEEQARALESLSVESKQLEASLSNNAYALPERDELVKLERQILSLGYDPAMHKSVAATATKLAQFESLRQGLLEAQRSLVREQQARDQAQLELAEWETAATAAEQRRAELLVETAGLAEVERDWGTAEAELRSQRMEQGRLREAL